MNIRWQVALCSLGLAALGLWATPAMADEWNKQTYFTFDQPVEVPGHVLAPGKYVFRLADVTADRNVVQIFSEDQNGMDHLVTTTMAIPDYRLTTPDKATVTFEERRTDTPEAVHSWFYPGDNYGWDFVYPKTARLQVAANTTPKVLQTSAAPAPKPVANPTPAKSAAATTAPEPAPQPVTVAQNRQPATPTTQTPQPAQSQQESSSTPNTLPQTASVLPLAESLGTLLLVLGAGMLFRRRRAHL